MDEVLNFNSTAKRGLPFTVSLITAILLAAAVFHWPYAYYVFLRVEVCLVFVWAAYLLFKLGIPVIPWVTFGLAILFNPIEKIYLDRSIWLCIDLACAFYMLAIHSVLRYKSSGKFI